MKSTSHRTPQHSNPSGSDLKTDVVVIGGGVIGTSIAYHLAKRHVDVILVEKDDIASGASGACDGFIFMQSKKPGVHLQMALESAKMMERLSVDLEGDIEYEKNGGMIVVKSREDVPEMRKLVEQQKRSGLEVDLLGAYEARQMEPCLSPDIAAATYSPIDAQVNPMMLCLAFARSARRMGAEIHPHTEVKDLSISNGRVTGVITSRGRIRARTVINAAGVYSSFIARMAGLDLPIKPRKGQILVTESVPRMLRRVVICSRYILSKFSPDSAAAHGIPQLGVGLALEQTRSGSLLIGSTREFAGYDRSVTPEGIRAVLKHATDLIPVLSELNVIRAFAGLRPYTPDGLPILGKAGNLEGFILATGHEGDGIALSPITGFLITELVATGKMPEDYKTLRRTYRLNQ